MPRGVSQEMGRKTRGRNKPELTFVSEEFEPLS
jgi:hypothetical protein